MITLKLSRAEATILYHYIAENPNLKEIKDKLLRAVIEGK